MLTVYEAGAIRDAAGCDARPGALAVRDGRIVAAGESAEVRRAVGQPDDRVAMPGWLLVPGMVNAHVHLDLTAMGQRPYGGDFIDWVGMVMAERPTDAACRAEAIRHGAGFSRAAGVRWVGDIAATPTPDLLRGAGLGGGSFGELFGLGPPFHHDALDAVRQAPDDAMVGWQPHAPYSAGPEVYRAAATSGRPCATHLAETPAELAFVAHATGPFRELLERLGRWDDCFAQHYRDGLSPVRWMQPYLQRVRWLCAHCNYISDDDIATLTASGASVAYCPRASDYFGHVGHRYRDMLEAGVNVCLGTDSIVCHGTLSIVDEMRRLHQRDGTDAGTLLAMATVNGAAALGLGRAAATFTADAAAGTLPGGVGRSVVGLRFDPDDAEDALTQVLRQDAAPAVCLMEDAT